MSVRPRLFAPVRASALALCGLLLATGAWAAELSAEERLEAVRRGLVQAALQGATQVQSTSWIDSEGVLRESSSFRSGMRVRGVRVLAYQRDRDGQPQASLQMQGSEDLLKPAASAAEAARACKEAATLRHVMDWRLDMAGRWSVDGVHLAQEAALDLVAAWQRAADASPRWRASAPLALGSSPDALRADGSPSARYMQLLTAAPAAQMAGWQARLRLDALPTPAQAGAPAGRMVASLSIAASENGASLFDARLELPLQGQAQAWSAPRLAEASRIELQRWVQASARALDERLACEPVKVQVLQAKGATVTVDQGMLAGLRAGDEWLVSDRLRLPHRMLEPAATSHIVLARVEKVSAQQAELRVLAGPANEVQARWQAWPMQSP